MADEERPLAEFMGHRSGWFVNNEGWVFFDSNWPHKPLAEEPKKRAKHTYYKRKGRRCGALLEDGQRCAGPYDCPEH